MADNSAIAPVAPLLLDAKAAAKALSISERTLWGLTEPRGPIRCIRIGRAVRYSPGELWEDVARLNGARR